jgi:hypothetical protein
MVGAATKWYYDHVLSLYNGKKEELTKCISHFGDETSPQFKPLDSLNSLDMNWLSENTEKMVFVLTRSSAFRQRGATPSGD